MPNTILPLERELTENEVNFLYAVRDNDFATAEALLSNPEDPVNVDTPDLIGILGIATNALLYVAERGGIDMLEVLLKYNPNLLARNQAGLTAAHLLARKDQDSMFETLYNKVVMNPDHPIELNVDATEYQQDQMQILEGERQAITTLYFYNLGVLQTIEDPEARFAAQEANALDYRTKYTANMAKKKLLDFYTPLVAAAENFQMDAFIISLQHCHSPQSLEAYLRIQFRLETHPDRRKDIEAMQRLVVNDCKLIPFFHSLRRLRSYWYKELGLTVQVSNPESESDTENKSDADDFTWIEREAFNLIHALAFDDKVEMLISVKALVDFCSSNELLLDDDFKELLLIFENNVKKLAPLDYARLTSVPENTQSQDYPPLTITSLASAGLTSEPKKSKRTSDYARQVRKKYKPQNYVDLTSVENPEVADYAGLVQDNSEPTEQATYHAILQQVLNLEERFPEFTNCIREATSDSEEDRKHALNTIKALIQKGQQPPDLALTIHWLSNYTENPLEAHFYDLVGNLLKRSITIRKLFLVLERIAQCPELKDSSAKEAFREIIHTVSSLFDAIAEGDQEAMSQLANALQKIPSLPNQEHLFAKLGRAAQAVVSGIPDLRNYLERIPLPTAQNAATPSQAGLFAQTLPVPAPTAATAARLSSQG